MNNNSLRSNNNRNGNGSQRGRRGRRRGGRSQSNLPQTAPSRAAPATMMNQPNLYPNVCITRIVEGAYDVICDGINPSLYGFNFSLNDVPGYTEFTGLFQTYCIESVELWWRPEYTVLSDASTLSSAINVEFNSCIDTTDGTAPATVDAVLQYQSCAHTGITFNHYRRVRPSYLMDNVIPACARLATASPSLNWYGVKVGVPPTGTAMTFRSVAKYKIVFTGLK